MHVYGFHYKKCLWVKMRRAEGEAGRLRGTFEHEWRQEDRKPGWERPRLLCGQRKVQQSWWCILEPEFSIRAVLGLPEMNLAFSHWYQLGDGFQSTVAGALGQLCSCSWKSVRHTLIAFSKGILTSPSLPSV